MTGANHNGLEVEKALFRQLPWGLIANGAVTLLVAAALWRSAKGPVLATWLAAQSVAIALRAALLVGFRRHKDTVPALWMPLFVAGVLVSGLVWGSSALLFLDREHPLQTVVVSFALGGMAAGAVSTLSFHARSFALFLLTSLGPLATILAAGGEELHRAMSGMIIIFAMLLFLIGRGFRLHWEDVLRLGEEKKHLLNTLEQQVLERTAALQDANTKLHGAMAERLRAQREAQQARAEAERANLAKTKFLAAASHDLRQPANSLTLLAAALEAQLKDHPAHKMAAHLEKTTKALSALLSSLLDISHLEAGGIVPDPVPVALGPVLERLAAEYVLRAAELGLSFRHVPSSALCLTDPVLLDRILRNLIENALRYTRQGGILIGCRRRAGRLVVQVVDTGIGIAENQLSVIFNEFFQVATPERRNGHQGVGLGLAIVSRLARILDHPVTVRSQLGHGSCFSVSIPLAAASEALTTGSSGEPFQR
jgi:signal transduction histidine kinase